MASYSILREVVRSTKTRNQFQQIIYSDEEILKEIARAIERYGRVPLQKKELKYDEEFKVDVKTVVRRFGSWRSAIESALSHTRGNGEEEL